MSTSDVVIDDKTCVLCGIKDGHPTSTLGDKGCHSIVAASKIKGRTLVVSPGQVVHKDCRRIYCHPNQNRLNSCSQENLYTSPSTRQSLEFSFDFQTKCFFCGTNATYKQHKRKRGRDVHPVLTLEFQKSIKDICLERNDHWGDIVLGRLEYVCDLPAVEARYHQSCSSNFRSGYQIPKCFQSPVTDDGATHETDQCNRTKKGRPARVCADSAFKTVLEEFEETEIGFTTISDLVHKMASICGEEDSYSTTYMKKRILEHYGSSIIITELNGKSNVVTFKSRAHAILHNYYHRQNKNDSENEKQAIIKTAGKLILNDIKCMEENTETYPSANEMTPEGNRKCVPHSLVTLLEQLIDQKDPDRIITAISQAIVQAVLPRSMICPLQLGLGVQLHHQFGSRILIETLNSLGFCCSYQEVQKYEKCAAYAQGHEVDKNSIEQYVQFVADNIDHNTATIDGHNTFHGMGIIATFTPKDKKRRVVARTQVTNEELVKIGKINIKYYKLNENFLEHVIFHKLEDIDCEDPIPDNFELLVKVARPLRPMTPSWSGIMQTVQKGEHPGESKIQFLPMIDMNPSDMSCIFSTLTYVAQQAHLLNVDPVITFDQPLYWKAMTIITNEPDSSDLKRTVIRLGAFHTEMSFLGCIGKVMENTGLSELLSTVYAPNTVCHMLSGKAVQRAIRGHFLVSDALDQLIMEKTFPELMKKQYIDDNNNQVDADNGNDEVYQYSNEQRELVEVLEDLFKEKIDQQIIDGNVNLNEMANKVERTKQTLESSRTAKLWLLYLEMINLLKQFIAAERMGNWLGHLKILRKMLPFFAAAGHNLYMKSSYMYLQQMNCLHITHPEVCKAFENGFHVVRRSDRFWSGLSTDLVIEQVLMRSIKSVGGLTRGRGLSELQRAQWILSMPACAEINFAMQEYTDKKYDTSDQHKDTAKSRIDRDEKDRQVFLEFLRERNPFSAEANLRNIETGSLAEANVNVDSARNVGEKILKDMEGKNVLEHSFKRADQVVTLGSKTNIKVGGDEITVDPQLLFQRIIAVADWFTDDPEEIFMHELSANPSSLFDNSGLMREAQKPQIANTVWDLGECDATYVPPMTLCHIVLDGGSLLQRIPWEHGSSFGAICSHYCRFVQANYKNAHIVFDGYANGPSTKDPTHERRTKGRIGAKISFSESHTCKTKKDSILTNRENKQNFIKILGEKLLESNCNVHYATDDADLLIVKTAVELSDEKPTVVIGEDTDLLILLCHHAEDGRENIFFKSDSGTKKKKIWDITKTKNILGEGICSILPVIHAFCGCDTVSRIYGVGKGLGLKKAMADTDFRANAQIFLKDSTHEEVETAGEQMMCTLFNGKKTEGLDRLRCRKFFQRVNTAKTVVQVQSLPPTSRSTKYHSYRVYAQVQTWLDRIIQPREWGWYEKDDRLTPLKCDVPAAPERLLKIIRCNCKQQCDSRRCTCRKHGLPCSTACGECSGIGCSNVQSVEDGLEN